MALQKSMTLANGSSGNYWKITRVVLDKASMQAQYYLTLFTSQTYADQTPQFDLGLSKMFSFQISKMDSTNDLLAYGYDQIKLLEDPDLSGVLDA